MLVILLNIMFFTGHVDGNLLFCDSHLAAEVYTSGRSGSSLIEHHRVVMSGDVQCGAVWCGMVW